MRITQISLRLLAVMVFSGSGLLATGRAQTTNEAGQGRPPAEQSKSTFFQTDVHCSGAIEYLPSYNLEIVGAEREPYRKFFGQNDYVYINGGERQGVRVGQEFAVVRPRGLFRGGYTKKKSFLGVYTQEVGKLRVTKVRDRTAIAEIETSCDMIQFGDFIRPVPIRSQPQRYSASTLDRFADAKETRQGRIVYARGNRELLTTNDVVHVDLGFEDGVKVNDTFMVTRRVKGRSVTSFRDDDIVVAATGGFESDAYKGGKFSNQSYRVRDPNRNLPGGPTTNFPDVRKRRPVLPERVIGEIIITSVQERSATGIVRRVTEEIHPGDYVERQ